MSNRIITCINAYAERWCEEWAGGCRRDRQRVRRRRPVGYAGIVLPSKTASSFPPAVVARGHLPIS